VSGSIKSTQNYTTNYKERKKELLVLYVSWSVSSIQSFSAKKKKRSFMWLAYLCRII